MRQCTTSTTNPFLLTETAPIQKPTWTLIFAGRSPHVMPPTHRRARMVIWLGNMAMLLRLRSLLRTFLSPLSQIFSSLPPSPTHPSDLYKDFRRNILTYTLIISFLDLYLSTAKGPASFFGNRSIVIHTSNKTRLTCANFTLATGNATTGGNGSSNGTSPVSPTLSSTPFPGGAATTFVGAGAVLAGVMALLL